LSKLTSVNRYSESCNSFFLNLLLLSEGAWRLKLHCALLKGVTRHRPCLPPIGRTWMEAGQCRTPICLTLWCGTSKLMSFQPHGILRRFSSYCEVLSAVPGGVFIRKTPLDCIDSALQQLEKRYCEGKRCQISMYLLKDSICLARYSRRSTGEDKIVEVEVAPRADSRSRRTSRCRMETTSASITKDSAPVMR
jgi:hypothetical protein